MSDISKKYTNAILKIQKDLQKLLQALEMLDLALSVKLKDIMLYDLFESPFFSNSKKLETFIKILNSLFINSNDALKTIKNMSLVLFQNKRLKFIPEIILDIKHHICLQNNVFNATIYTKQSLPKEKLSSLKQDIEDRLKIKINIDEKLHEKHQILLEIPDIELSVSFSQDKFLKELKTHILKAI